MCILYEEADDPAMQSFNTDIRQSNDSDASFADRRTGRDPSGSMLIADQDSECRLN